MNIDKNYSELWRRFLFPSQSTGSWSSSCPAGNVTIPFTFCDAGSAFVVKLATSVGVGYQPTMLNKFSQLLWAEKEGS